MCFSPCGSKLYLLGESSVDLLYTGDMHRGPLPVVRSFDGDWIETRRCSLVCACNGSLLVRIPRPKRKDVPFSYPATGSIMLFRLTETIPVTDTSTMASPLCRDLLEPSAGQRDPMELSPDGLELVSWSVSHQCQPANGYLTDRFFSAL